MPEKDAQASIKIVLLPPVTKFLVMRNLWYIIVLALCFVGCKSQPEHKLTIDYKAVGDSLINKTFDTLSHALIQAMAASGPEGAIGLCNEKAIEITGIYGTADFKINRTALRVRNTANKPTADELEILQAYQHQMEKGDSLKPLLVKAENGEHHYYKPILLKPMCLSCHGLPDKEIAANTLNAISAKYPLDMATGFTAGSLRGMWHVQFSK